MAKELEPKEEQLAAALNLEPVTLEPIDLKPNNRMPLSSTHPPPLPDFSYRTDYPHIDDDEVSPHTSVMKKMHFIQDESNQQSVQKRSSDPKVLTASDLEFLNSLSRRSANLHVSMPGSSASMTQSLNFVTTRVSPDIPIVKRVPDYMHIPNLWNAHIERGEDDNGNGLASGGSRESTGSGSSEWEFL